MKTMNNIFAWMNLSVRAWEIETHDSVPGGVAAPAAQRPKYLPNYILFLKENAVSHCNLCFCWEYLEFEFADFSGVSIVNLLRLCLISIYCVRFQFTMTITFNLP